MRWNYGKKHKTATGSHCRYFWGGVFNDVRVDSYIRRCPQVSYPLTVVESTCITVKLGLCIGFRYGYIFKATEDWWGRLFSLTFIKKNEVNLICVWHCGVCLLFIDEGRGWWISIFSSNVLFFLFCAFKNIGYRLWLCYFCFIRWIFYLLLMNFK